VRHEALCAAGRDEGGGGLYIGVLSYHNMLEVSASNVRSFGSKIGACVCPASWYLFCLGVSGM
jgi:hypothetical protein